MKMIKKNENKYGKINKNLIKKIPKIKKNL